MVTPTVAVLILEEGKVLLVRHEDAGHEIGTYGFPSGVFEGHEEKSEAIRELKEETGLTSQEKDLEEFPNNFYTADIKRKDKSVKKFSMKVFICKRYSGELRGSKETIPEWVLIDKLNNYHLLPNVEKAILAGLRFLKS